MYLTSFLLWTTAVSGVAAQEGTDKLQTVIQRLIDAGVDIGGRILGALIIFVVGRFIIAFLNKLLKRILEKRKVDAGIQSFVCSLVNILLMVLLIVAIVDKLGIETTSFAALLASAGVAVGMALSGNLQNFAGGLIIKVKKRSDTYFMFIIRVRHAVYCPNRYSLKDAKSRFSIPS